MEFKSFYSELQDTQVDILPQDVSEHQPSALSDLLGGSTSMDVDVDTEWPLRWQHINGCRHPLMCCHLRGLVEVELNAYHNESVAGAPWHRPSDVVEAARARVASLGPHDQAWPGSACNLCVSSETLQQCGARKEWLAGEPSGHHLDWRDVD
jgi:hypothetical protein